MKVAYMGGNIAGAVGLLALKTQAEVPFVISYSSEVTTLCDQLGVEMIPDPLQTPKTINRIIDECDWLLCVHGREYVPKSLRDEVPCVNIHPGQPGSNPMGRQLEAMGSGILTAKLTSQLMTDEIDLGEQILCKMMNVTASTVGEIYNQMYPMYIEMIINVCKKYNGENVGSHVWKNSEQVQSS